MNCRILVKALLYLLMGLLSASLAAAEIRDGQLWLEVLLASGNKIEFASPNSTEPVISVSEKNAPISRVFTGRLSIELFNTDKLAFWGFLNRSEPWTSQPEGYLAEKFVWQDSSLVIQKENLVFEETTFPGLDSARRYAQETGIPENQIRSLPLINSTVRVTTDEGAEQYFETPLLIHSDRPVYIGGIQLGFAGDFILKSVGGKMVVNHFIPLEQYVSGVVQNEIGNDAPLEALKAQAIAARSHAVDLLLYNRHQNDGYDLCSGTHCQVYKGEYLLNDAVREAVQATSGEILTIKGKIAPSLYHSACGGKTESSVNVWGGDPLPHLLGVTCIPEAQSYDLSQESQARLWIETEVSTSGLTSWEKGALSWEKSIPRQTLAKNLGLAYLSRIIINKRGFSGRITDMSFIGEVPIRLTSEYKIREAFGQAKSSFFYIRGPYAVNDDGSVEIVPGGTVSIKGKGSGHGVGMCQVGARRMAAQGVSYREILSHYYPGTSISSDWMRHAQ